jgi:glutathione S-transferase
MGRPGENHDIILFCYDTSVFSRRIEYYLGLRGFKYTRCTQPPRLPRPDLDALGIKYRRIPVLAIGRDIYMDTRIMIEKLESRFPCNTLSSKEPFYRGIEKIIESWVIEAGPWGKTAASIPAHAPVMRDPVWLEDRKRGSGGNITAESLKENRASALVDLNSYFYWAEHGLLADGRKYLFNTEDPTLGDVHAVWSYDWALHMAMGDSADESCEEDVINSWRFPKVNAWVDRFKQAHATAIENSGKPELTSGDDAKRRILACNFTELDGTVDLCDPLNLTKGQMIEVRPTDFGSTHADRGELVSLCSREVVISIKINDEDGHLRLHYPRAGFRITPVEGSSSMLSRWLHWLRGNLQSLLLLPRSLWPLHSSKRVV